MRTRGASQLDPWGCHGLRLDLERMEQVGQLGLLPLLVRGDARGHRLGDADDRDAMVARRAHGSGW